MARSTDTTEPTDADTSAPVEPTTEPVADVATVEPNLLDALDTALAAALDNDPTGEAPLPATAFDPLASAYRGTRSSTGRLRIVADWRAKHAQAVLDALGTGDEPPVAQARAASIIGDALANLPTKRAAVERDPLDVAASVIAGTRVALDALNAYAALDGLDVDALNERVDALLTGDDDADALKRAQRVINAASTGGTRRERGDVNAHIVEVLSEHRSGMDADEAMTYGDIADVITSAYPDPESRPSPGGVQNALDRLHEAGTVVVTERTASGAPKRARIA